MDDAMLQHAIADTRSRALREKRALSWTLKSLSTDVELELFVDTLSPVLWSWPTFTRRRRHDALLQNLIDYPGVNLAKRISTLLLSCDAGLLEKAAKQNRAIICLKALSAFALASAELRPRSLVFPFTPYILAYIAKTTYAPAQPYLPSLRTCSGWSIYCTFLTNVHQLMLLCDVEARSRQPRRDLVLHGLRDVVGQHRQYLDLRGITASRQQAELENAASVLAQASPSHILESLNPLHRLLRRLWDGKTTIQIETLCMFLLDCSSSDHAPHYFKETISVLHPEENPSGNVIPASLAPTLARIVERANGVKSGTHVDHAISVLLRLCDTPLPPSMELPTTDALITYLNDRALPAALLALLRDLDIAVVWSRIISRLGRRDRPDDVLTALWRLSQLLLSPSFPASRLAAIPLRSLVDTAAHLPVSPYTLSVDAMLRAVASHAAESIHIHSTSARDASPIRVALNFVELNYMTARLLSSATPPESAFESTDISADMSLDVMLLGSQVYEARVTLFTEYIAACAASPSSAEAQAPYKAAETLAFLGSAALPPGVGVSPDLQLRFAHAFRLLAQWQGQTQNQRQSSSPSDDSGTGTDSENLIQIILDSPLVAGLQWIDAPDAIATMRRTLDGAFVSMQQLPVVVDALARLLVVEEESREQVETGAYAV